MVKRAEQSGQTGPSAPTATYAGHDWDVVCADSILKFCTEDDSSADGSVEDSVPAEEGTFEASLEASIEEDSDAQLAQDRNQRNKWFLCLVENQSKNNKMHLYFCILPVQHVSLLTDHLHDRRTGLEVPPGG